MPIIITLPSHSNEKTVNTKVHSAVSRLSSRKLLHIATDVALEKTDCAVQSAIIELQQREHYLPELEAEGLLIRS